MKHNKGKLLLTAVISLAVFAAVFAALWFGRPPAADRGGDACTLSVSCAVLLDKPDALEEGKRELVPADGFILPPTEVAFSEGESAFDVLNRTLREKGVHMEFSETPVYQSVYIEGIGNIYELDGGPMSGWLYLVNGSMPEYGCSQYSLQNGDKVEFLYSCDGGADIGLAWGGETP